MKSDSINEKSTIKFFSAAVFLFFFFPSLLYAQYAIDNIDFKPRVARVDDPTQGTGIYSIKGDFAMIGNSNLTAASYWVNNVSDVENTYPMIFVDVDDNPSTVNSSKATLRLSDENGVDHNCTNILFAGLYWGGIGDASNRGSTGPGTWQVAPRQYLQHGQSYNGWTVSINVYSVSNNVKNANSTSYTFSKSGQNNVVIEIWGSTATPTLQMGSSSTAITEGVTCRPMPNTSPNRIVSVIDLKNPIVLGSGSNALTIRQLTFTSGTSSISSATYRGMSLVTVETGALVTLDKKKIKFKHADQSAYQEITADINPVTSESAIFYKTGVSGRDNIYSAFADVTEYVRANGVGEYTVADIATTDGCGTYLYSSGGDISLRGNESGKSAGWGMIVIYENNGMNWRNVSVFDGYSYIESTSGSTVINEYPITINGVKTIQNGPVNMKLGGIAFEGDRNLGGDYLQVEKISDNTWLSLSHDTNEPTNFFNSSVYLGGNPRNPESLNNFGTDIYVFNIPNENNTVIENKQTTLKFKTGTTSDNFVINTFAFAVDAFVPEIDPYNHITKINGQPVSSQKNLTVKPGQEIEYVLEIRNVGNEPFKDAYVDIPIPYNATIVNYAAEYFEGTTGTIEFNKATNTLHWTSGSVLPVLEDDPILGRLTYTVKATEDCYILTSNCLSGVTIQGYISGEGTISGEKYENVKLTHDVEVIGDCYYEQIKEATVVDMDMSDYDCTDISGFRTFVYPADMGTLLSIPVSEIRTYFPADVRFYDKIDESTGEPAAGAIEFNDTNPFPKVLGKYFYYGVYTVLEAKCWQKFSINVFSVENSLCEGEMLSDIFSNTVLDDEDVMDISRFDYFLYDTNSEEAPNIQIPTDYVFLLEDNDKYVKYEKCRTCVETELDIESNFIRMEINEVPQIADNQSVLYPGSTYLFTATPTGGTWTSSDPAILSVSTDGTVSAIAAGEALLTYELNGCEASVSLKVLSENKWIGQNRGLNPEPGGLDGDENNHWSILSNWTGGRLPESDERVIFHEDAVSLHANSNGNTPDNIFVVKGVDNATAADLVIPVSCGLKLTENTPANKAINFTGGANVIIQSEDPDIAGSVNGTFIVPEDAKVNAIVHFYTKAKGPADATEVAEMAWQYFGLPVKSFVAGNLHGAYVRRYDETKTVTEEDGEGNSLIYYWHWLTNNDLMSPVTGYEISRREIYSGKYTFSGELNTSDINTVLSITPDAYFRGQHVVSNPYTAALNIKTGLELGTDSDDTFYKTIYLFHTGTPAQWQSQIGTEGNIPGQYLSVPQQNAGEGSLPAAIPSMQGFVVLLDPDVIADESNKDARTLKIKYSTGVNNENLNMRRGGTRKAKTCTMVSVSSDDILKDRMWIFTNENATRRFDNGYDGKKIFGASSLAQLFAYEEDGIYQVSTVPDIHNTYLGFKPEKGIRDYALTFNHSNTDETMYQCLYLVDLETNNVTEITADNSTYSFTAGNESAAGKRFVIISTPKEYDAAGNLLNIYQHDKNILFVNGYDKEILINIYNTAGVFIRQLKLPYSGCVSVSENEFGSGVYVIKAIGGDIRNSSRKLIIN